MNRNGPWIALDVGLLRNRKLEELGRAAPALLYIACLAHCGDELTDGYVRAGAMPRLLVEARARRDGRANDVRALELAGLLEPVHGGELIPLDDGGELVIPGAGWVIRDYSEWNPTRAWWEQQRQNAAERQRAKRARDAGTRVPERIQTESRANPERYEPRDELEPERAPTRAPKRAKAPLSRVTDTVTHETRSGSDETRERELPNSRPVATERGALAAGLSSSRDQAPAPVSDVLRSELERLAGDGVV